MISVLDDINKRRTRQPVGEQPAAAPVEPVAPVAQPMGEPAAARVTQGAMPQAESGFNPTAEQKATAMMPVNPALTGESRKVTGESQAPKQMSYTDLHKEFYKVMTPEEKAAQQKRQRSRQIINAVGDGISALANLYYTNKSGVNAYDPSTSLTKAAKERYDKLLAQQREDEERYKEMAYRSGAADIEMAYRRAKDAAAEKRADDAIARQDAKDKQAQENFDKQFEAEQSYKEWLKKFKEDSLAAEKEYKKLLAEGKNTNNLIRSVQQRYGKAIQFERSNDTPLEIYEGVWKGSMPQVYNVLLSEAGTNGIEVLRGWTIGLERPTWSQMDTWVKENWFKSDKAKMLMQHMARDTPGSFINDYSDNSSPFNNSNNDEASW